MWTFLPIALAGCAGVGLVPLPVLSVTAAPELLLPPLLPPLLLLLLWGVAELELAWGVLPPADLNSESNHQRRLLSGFTTASKRRTHVMNCTYFGVVLITRWTVNPSLMPCWLKVSESFRIFPANINTSCSCSTLNFLHTSCLNWTNETRAGGRLQARAKIASTHPDRSLTLCARLW